MTRKKDHISTGNCGQYFAAAELERHGFTAALTLVNTRAFDILAINRTTGKSIAIQVKTTSGNQKRWIFDKKVEKLHGANIFYILVVLHGDKGIPEYHIVPSNFLARHIRNGYKRWIKAFDSRGRPHNETNARGFEDKKDKYLDRWDLLSKK